LKLGFGDTTFGDPRPPGGSFLETQSDPPGLAGRLPDGVKGGGIGKSPRGGGVGADFLPALIVEVPSRVSVDGVTSAKGFCGRRGLRGLDG